MIYSDKFKRQSVYAKIVERIQKCTSKISCTYYVALQPHGAAFKYKFKCTRDRTPSY